MCSIEFKFNLKIKRVKFRCIRFKILSMRYKYVETFMLRISIFKQKNSFFIPQTPFANYCTCASDISFWSFGLVIERLLTPGSILELAMRCSVLREKQIARIFYGSRAIFLMR